MDTPDENDQIVCVTCLQVISSNDSMKVGDFYYHWSCLECSKVCLCLFVFGLCLFVVGLCLFVFGLCLFVFGLCLFVGVFLFSVNVSVSVSWKKILKKEIKQTWKQTNTVFQKTKQFRFKCLCCAGNRSYLLGLWRRIILFLCILW